MKILEPGQIEILTGRPMGAGVVACEVRTPEKTGITYFGSVNDGIQVGDIREALSFCRIGPLVHRDTMGRIDPGMVSVVDAGAVPVEPTSAEIEAKLVEIFGEPHELGPQDHPRVDTGAIDPEPRTISLNDRERVGVVDFPSMGD